MELSRIIAVSNRHCFDGAEDTEKEFLERIGAVLAKRPRGLVLREKDLQPEAYRRLAEKVMDLAAAFLETRLILHGFPEVARELGAEALHLPLGELVRLHREAPELLKAFREICTSVHSREDALLAVDCGASYCFAGNVFETTCKPGLSGKGLGYLREIVSAVSVPVYGIGGIRMENMPAVLETGAAGGCMMSGFFSEDVRILSEKGKEGA